MNASQAVPMAKTTGMRRMWPLEKRFGAPDTTGEALGGGGSFST